MSVSTEQYQTALLHKHWLAAEGLDYHLRRSMKYGPAESHDMPSELIGLGATISMMKVLEVYYSLIYVVIEGYHERKFTDEKIDALLVEGNFTDLLKRLRNGTFHYQNSAFPEKVMRFLIADDSAVWIAKVRSAFNEYFERKMKMQSVLDSLKDRS